VEDPIICGRQLVYQPLNFLAGIIFNKLEAECSSSGPVDVQHSNEMIAIAGTLQQFLLVSQVSHLRFQSSVRHDIHIVLFPANSGSAGGLFGSRKNADFGSMLSNLHYLLIRSQSNSLRVY